MTTLRPVLLLLAAAALGAGAAAQEPTLAWSVLDDGGATLADDGVAVIVAADGHPVVGGVRTPAGGNGDLLVRKLDRETGDPLWTYTYTDPAGNDMQLVDILFDHRGDIMVAGYLSACDG